MDDFEDLSIYDSDPVHDMYVDYDYNINTGELPDRYPPEYSDEE